VLTPATTDVAVARSWMLGHAQTGLEGVVAKRIDQTYRPGVRAWHKLRTRVTAEAVVGGVIGRNDAPRELILGRFGPHGRLRIAGRTTRLSPTASAQLAALLRPASAHPWPETLPPHPYGGGRTIDTRLRPEAVVEVSADLALDGLRWRHPVRFVRIRGELTAADLAGEIRLVESLVEPR
jgi:ATP-dependent DNA ligase